MSDLLNKASLVMIPSGYKEDVVYSAVPSDGSGDLAFSRASNGTRVNSAGLVEVCPWNLAFDSENFGSGYWARLSSATITTNNTTAPNGTNTGALFSVTSTAYSGLIEGIPDNTQTISMYAKKGTLDYLWFIHENISQLGASFNLNTGVVSFVAGGHNASIESVGNGWYRCILSTTSSATWDFFQFGLSNASNSATSPSGGNAYIWGAQANIGSTAKPYFPTTDRLNVPRLTYQNGGGGCPSLLLEKQSTNLIEYSNCISAFAFAGTFTASATTSPEGVSNAFSFLVNAGQNGGLSFITLTTSAQSYTFSAYLKGSANGQKVKLYGDLNGTIEEFTLTTDWVRYTKTFTGSVGAQSVYLLNGSYFSPSQNNLYYGYGFQLEVSSYATSLIPSNGASATRVADACFKTGISSLIGQTSGTVFFDFTLDTISAQTNDPVLWYMKGGGTGERHIQLLSNGNLRYIEFNGAVIASITKSGLTVGRHKYAIAYANNDMIFYVDGVQIGTDTSGTPSGFSEFGLQYYNATFNGEQKVNQAVIFPTRLTNAELASLTTI